MSIISDAFAKQPTPRSGVQKTPELGRILALPRRKLDLDAGTVDGQPILDLNSLYLTNPGKCQKWPHCPVCAIGKASLWPTQSAALIEAERGWGLFAAVGVGSGKTLVTLLLPDVFGAQRAVLLVPSSLKNQLITRDFADYGRHFKLPLDRIKVVSYDELSIATGAFVLDRFEPDLIVADECFSYDSKVVTDVGEVSIGEIVDGGVASSVLSMNVVVGRLEWKSISRRLRKLSPSKMLKVTHAYGEFVCTENHKVWTEDRGYVRADELRVDDLLRVVRRSVLDDEKVVEVLRPELLRSVQKHERSISTCTSDRMHSMQQESVQDVSRRETSLLLQRVPSQVQQCEKLCAAESEQIAAGSASKEAEEAFKGKSESRSIHERVLERGLFEAVQLQDESKEKFKSSVLLGELRRSSARRREEAGEFSTNDREQPDARSCGESASCSFEERADVLVPRRERSNHCTAEDVGGGSAASDGACDRNSASTWSISESSALLQSGSGVPRAEASDRGGWANAHECEVEILGPSEGISSCSSRVVSVEVLEQGSVGGSDRSGDEGPYVYDLEVADNHNYIVDGVVVSNCHNLAKISSARTKRFVRYMQTHPSTRFCGLSGTVTRRSLRDYSHICEIALRHGSPLPYRWSDLQEWADALDPIKDPIPIGALRVFIDPKDTRLGRGLDEERQAAREGFRRRLVETPGVVATSESWEGASLVITALRPAVPKAITISVSNLLKTWEIDGEEIEEKMRLKEVARQLSVGFYYRWIWPDDKPDREWLDARALWHKTVRQILNRSRAGMDSPLLVARAIERGVIDDVVVTSAWEAWKAVRERYRPTPPVEAVWIDDFVIREAHAWAAKQVQAGEPSIIWYSHAAVGDALSDTGLPLYDSGRDAGEADPAREPVIICSIRAQGTGKNLQRYARSLVVEPPASGATTEQLLGRTHRPGQQADEVNYEYFMHTAELEEAPLRAVEDARYVQQTQGQRQKLLVARRVGW